MLILIARFLAAGTAVLLAGLIAKKLGPLPAGMILSFPFVIGTGLLFASFEPAPTFRTVAFGALLGLIPLAAFLLTVLALTDRTSPWLAMAAGVAAWLIVAGGIYLGKALL